MLAIYVEQICAQLWLAMTGVIFEKESECVFILTNSAWVVDGILRYFYFRRFGVQPWKLRKYGVQEKIILYSKAVVNL